MEHDHDETITAARRILDDYREAVAEATERAHRALAVLELEGLRLTRGELAERLARHQV